MKKVFFKILLLISFQCSKNGTEAEKPFTVDQLQFVPRNILPKASLPEWIVKEINDFDEWWRTMRYGYLQIAKGEWNEQIVYLFRNWSDMTSVFTESGIEIYYKSERYITDLSTSKNWVVIYEFGDVTYPIIIGEDPRTAKVS